MKRRILSALVALCLIVALLPMSVMAASYPDTDGHWAEKSIDRWSNAAVVYGTDGEFRPDLSITRAQIAAIFARLLRLPAASPAEYHDLTADAWYADAVSRCAAAGILTGYPDGTFRPNDPVTREQACAMLARALGISELRRADLSDFPDAADTGDWAEGYVAAMLNRGILTGLSGKLAPKAPVTRAQFVTMLDRAIAVYADEDGMTVKAADMDEDGVIVVVAEDVKIKDAPAGTKVVAAASAKKLNVNGKSVDADQVHTVPETPERPKSAGHAHTHEYKYTDNGDGTHTGTCTANDSTLDPEAHTIVDGKCTICGAAQTADAVASVLGEDGTYTYYDSLVKALDAVANGGTVKLVTDETLNAQLAITKSVTIDLGGHMLKSTWAMSGNQRYAIISNAPLTMQNGTVTVGQARAISAYDDLTLSSVTVTQELTGGHACVAFSAAGKAYTITNSTVKGAYAVCSFTDNATIHISGSELIGTGNVLYHNGSNYGLDLTVTDTTITGTGNGCGVYISGSTTTLANGGLQKATFKNCTISGTNGVEVKYTDLTLEDCTVTATGALSYEQNNNGPAASGCAVVATDNTMKPTEPAPNGIITITGEKGRYTGPIGLRSIPEVIASYPNVKESTYAITGGTFSSDPSDYVAEGYITLVNGDGTFTVSNTNEIPVTTATAQDYLDGKYGSINGKTLVLGEGNYDKIEFGRATAYKGSNTEYYRGDITSTVDEIKQDIADHPRGGAKNRVYVRNMSNVTLKAADGATATINGLVAFGGQVNSTKWYSRDFVADRDMSATENNNISYWVGQKWSNITFEGLTFTDGVNIEAYGNNKTNIDNVKFTGCKFNVNDSTTNETYCMRLNVDGNVAEANNLVVEKCEFTDGYTAVLTDGMPNVTVTDSTFSGLVRHAINPMMNELPNAPGYGRITVTGNTFKNMSTKADKGTILRMGEVGAGAVFTIRNNTATEGITLANSIKVNSLADGITYNISGNNWGSLTASHTILNDSSNG